MTDTASMVIQQAKRLFELQRELELLEAALAGGPDRLLEMVSATRHKLATERESVDRWLLRTWPHLADDSVTKQATARPEATTARPVTPVLSSKEVTMSCIVQALAQRGAPVKRAHLMQETRRLGGSIRDFDSALGILMTKIKRVRRAGWGMYALIPTAPPPV